MSKIKLPMTTLLKQSDIYLNCSDDEFKKCYLSGWNFCVNQSDLKRKIKLYKDLANKPDFILRKNEVLFRHKNKIKSPNRAILGLQRNKRIKKTTRTTAVDDPLCQSDECCGLSFIHFERHPELLVAAPTVTPNLELLETNPFINLTFQLNPKTLEIKILSTKIIHK